jgi:predicted transglutaminase-like cysteine proteinase
VLFFGFVAVAAVVTNATAASKIPAVVNTAAGAARTAQSGLPESSPPSIVVASLSDQSPSAADPAPITAPSLRTTIAPLISSAPAQSPVQFFTINEVLTRHADRQLQGNIQLASVDPTATPDAPAHGKGTTKSNEPFGLFTFVAPDSIVWFRWRQVADDIRAQEPTLMRCLADDMACSPGATRFAAIVKEARAHEGRVRLNFVNQRVNGAIRYTSDMTQWGTPDEWSAPLAGGKGSFETGLGDCEDYAIAKYVALRAAGVSAKQLRVLLVRDNIARLDHAVLAANEEGHWFILDNRWTVAVEDTDVRRFTPLFALDDQGVKLLAAPYAERAEPRIDPMSEVVSGGNPRPLPAGEDAGSSSSGVSALGLRPSIF